MAAGTNIYGYFRESTLDEFAPRLEGVGQGLVLVVLTNDLTEEAREALAKSFEAIGYGAESPLFANLAGLEAGEVFRLIEGIDPLCLVATDEDAAALCAQASREEFPLMQPTRLFGREARGFTALNSLLSSTAGKQAVWRLLKSLG